MIDFDMRQELGEYLASIETEIGGSLEYTIVADLALRGNDFGYEVGQDNQTVLVTQRAFLPTTAHFEAGFAHEATHWLLGFRGYAQPKPKKKLSDLENEYISICQTMVQDLVVNRLIEDNGFKVCGDRLVALMVLETEAHLKGGITYGKGDFAKDGKLQTMQRVMKRLLYEASLDYPGTSLSDRTAILAFLKAHGETCPLDVTHSETIQAFIKSEDIFTTEGYKKVVNEVASFWGISSLVDYA